MRANTAMRATVFELGRIKLLVFDQNQEPVLSLTTARSSASARRGREQFGVRRHE